MKSKVIFLTISVIFLAALASAQSGPLQSFSFEPSDDFSLDLTGGENQSLNSSFENTAGKELPLVVKITASSDQGMSDSGAEFSFTARLTSSSGQFTNETDLSCSHDRRKDENTSLFSCSSDQNEILPQYQGSNSENDLTINMSVADRIYPGQYNITKEVRSQVGVPEAEEEDNVSANKSEEIQTSSDNSEVSVNITPDKEANVTLQVYEEVSTDPPSSDQDIVSGVDIEVSNDTEDEVEANGTVNISYEQSLVNSRNIEESTLQVYFYNETSGEWEAGEVNETNRNTVENFIVAEVPHFSLYAAYGEKESGSEGSDDDEYDTTAIQTSPSQDNQSSDNHTSEDESQEQDTGTNETQERDQGTGEGGEGTDESTEESGTEEDGQSGILNNPPLGQFSQSPGSIALGLFIITLICIGLGYHISKRFEVFKK